MDRDVSLKEIQESKEWDVLVIGGGATGLGVALDAVSRGYKTLLVEQSDFAKGTSSRSTKLVHGGVRYLAQGDIALVREASIERGLLQKNAPHLVKNQTFIIPVYSVWDKIKYTIGLKFYDRIAGKLSLGYSFFIGKRKTLQYLPGIRAKGLKGGVIYHDGQFDDSRLAVNLAQSIVDKGGCVVNYVKVCDLLKDGSGKICGAIIKDTETAAYIEVKAKAVVNATGVFVDNILQMDNPSAPKMVVASQGVHLVLDKKFYSSGHALMIPKTKDGRVLFAVPWHNKVVVGTTDTPVGQPSIEPQALEKEINFILNTMAGYLQEAPQRKDVLSIFAGLRPLAAPKKEQQKTKEISRSHKIIVSDSGLFTILGGKWTTYRKMGEDMINTVERHLMWRKRRSLTASMQIHGYKKDPDWSDPLYVYGSDAASLRTKINSNDNGWLSHSLKIHEEQVRWAVAHEMARTVEDVLSRRTRALLLNAQKSIQLSKEVASIMAEMMRKDKNWEEKQVADFENVAKNYMFKF